MSEITITDLEATALYSATVHAIGVIEDVMKRRSAEPYINALSIELASYKRAQDKLVAAIPELRP